MTPNSPAANAVDIWRPAGFPALELHKGQDVTVDYPRHWHDEFYLSATLDGVSHLQCDGAWRPVARGQLLLLPPGVVHANRKVGCTARTVFLEFAALRDAVGQFTERHGPALEFRTGIIDDPRMIAAFLDMHRTLETPRFELQQESVLFDFLARTAFRHGAGSLAVSRPGAEDAAVRIARDYLTSHYAERVRLADLARVTRVSPYHLHRSFSRTVGMPPHEYQTQLRIAHARRYLRQGRSVSDTASLVGFFDQSHFLRAFKRSEGITPGRYIRFSKNLQDSRASTIYFGSP